MRERDCFLPLFAILVSSQRHPVHDLRMVFPVPEAGADSLSDRMVGSGEDIHWKNEDETLKAWSSDGNEIRRLW